MQIPEKQVLLDSSIERAAALLGDLTPHVFARYYPAFPEAHERFEELSLHSRNSLEGQIIEQSLYCLMQWFESPGQIRIVIVGTVSHHIETLQISPSCFSGLMDTICDVIVSTIPADCPGERAVWQELREAMQGLFAEGCKYVFHPA